MRTYLFGREKSGDIFFFEIPFRSAAGAERWVDEVAR